MAVPVSMSGSTYSVIAQAAVTQQPQMQVSTLRQLSMKRETESEDIRASDEVPRYFKYEVSKVKESTTPFEFNFAIPILEALDLKRPSDYLKSLLFRKSFLKGLFS